MYFLEYALCCIETEGKSSHGIGFLFTHDAPSKFILDTKRFSSETVSKWFKVYMDILTNDYYSYLETKIGEKESLLNAMNLNLAKENITEGTEWRECGLLGLLKELLSVG